MRADVELVFASLECDLDVGSAVIRLPRQPSSRMSVVIEALEFGDAATESWREDAGSSGPFPRPECRCQDCYIEIECGCLEVESLSVYIRRLISSSPDSPRACCASSSDTHSSSRSTDAYH
jgi:hypothetical protein